MKVMCRLGFHDWETEYFNTGYSHRACHNCSKCEEKEVGSPFWRTRRTRDNLMHNRNLKFRAKHVSDAGSCPDCNGSTVGFTLGENQVIIHCKNSHQWVSSRHEGRQPCKNLNKGYCTGVSGMYAQRFVGSAEYFECRFGVYRECYEEVN